MAWIAFQNLGANFCWSPWQMDPAVTPLHDANFSTGRCGQGTSNIKHSRKRHCRDACLCVMPATLVGRSGDENTACHAMNSDERKTTHSFQSDKRGTMESIDLILGMTGGHCTKHL